MPLNYRFIGFVFALSTSFLAQSNVLDSLRAEEQGGRYYVIHKVEKGETLYSLTRRYGANLLEVKEANAIEANSIDLGQELRIPVEKPVDRASPEVVGSSSNHVVKTGETLFAISRMYGVEVQQLKEWNQLSSNEISIGQMLKVGNKSLVTPSENPVGSEVVKDDRAKAEKKNKKEDKRTPEKPAVPSGFSEYYVQSGDLLESIAGKFRVRPDSIVIWNKLPNTYLTIGQKLLIKGKPNAEELRKKPNSEKLPYGTRTKYTDQSGFVKILEEGTARKIEDVVETQKYLALHRSLKIGTMIEIRNLMNNQKIFARVVGRLPETGLNKNVLVRLTPICFERLGVIDPLTRVEVSYYED